MSKRNRKTIVLMIAFFLFLLVGCNDKVNFAKAEKVVNSYITAQVANDKNKIKSLISQELEKKLDQENLNFENQYNLKRPKVASINIFELQSNGREKVIAANYLVEGGGKKLNNNALFYLEKEGEKWIIHDLEENSMSKTLKS